MKAGPFDSDLPNSLSHECEGLDELCVLLERSALGELPCAPPPSEPRPVDEYLASLTGPLASDRIIDVVESRETERKGLPPASLLDRLRGSLAANRRRRRKRHAVRPHPVASAAASARRSVSRGSRKQTFASESPASTAASVASAKSGSS